MRTLIKHVLAAAEPQETVTVKGWVRTRRDAKGFSFLELNDGSCLANLQIVVDAGTPGFDHLPHLTTGASAVVEGNWWPPRRGPEMGTARHAGGAGRGGGREVSAPEEGAYAGVPADYRALAPALESLRGRLSVRSRLAFAVHQFFQERDFVYVHTPIITASDCEGAGEMFRVTTLKGNIDEKPAGGLFSANRPI